MAAIPSSQTTARVRLGLRSAGILMTPEEFDAAPEGEWDDRYRYELIRGVLVVTPPASIGERDPNEELGYWLRSYHDTHPQGRALDLTVSEHTVPLTDLRRRPDRVIWAGLGRTPDPDKDVPTIVVEFVSRSRRDFARDYEQKRTEYLAAGVSEYWIIDRFRRKMTIHRSPPEGVVEQTVLESQTYQTALLPGFDLPLARLFALADRWTPDPRKANRPHRKGRNGG